MQRLVCNFFHARVSHRERPMKTSFGDDKYPFGNKRPPSRTIATSFGVNKEFHKKNLNYSPGTGQKLKNTVPCEVSSSLTLHP